MHYLVIKCALGEYHIVETHHKSVVATELQERKARNIVFGIDLQRLYLRVDSLRAETLREHCRGAKNRYK